MRKGQITGSAFDLACNLTQTLDTNPAKVLKAQNAYWMFRFSLLDSGYIKYNQNVCISATYNDSLHYIPKCIHYVETIL